MSVEVTQMDLVSRAAATAGRVASAADLAISEIGDIGRLTEAARLFDRVWGSSAEEPLISAATLKALAHSGNYLSAAYRDGTLLGACVGWLGRHNGELQLHSHILGVAPDVQGRSVGYALKLHQRAWSLERGISTITWTFDPLVRRNAYFNLTKLRASITAYYDNFYGEMPDGINAGDESDRVLVDWSLAALDDDGLATVTEPDVDALRAAGAATILSAGGDGAPVVRSDATAPTLLVQLPEDIVAVRASDPARALAWRRAVRGSLGVALRNGFVANAMTRSGWYVLSRGESS